MIGLWGTHIFLRMVWGTLRPRTGRPTLRQGQLGHLVRGNLGGLLIGFQGRYKEPPICGGRQGMVRWTRNLGNSVPTAELSWISSMDCLKN